MLSLYNFFIHKHFKTAIFAKNDSKIYVFIGVLYNYFHKNVFFIIHLFFLFIGWCFCLYFGLYYILYNNVDIEIVLFNWISFNFFIVNFGFFFDFISLVFLFLIYTISWIVHFYSLDYMRSDSEISRFLSYLSLFTFFMVLMISSNNYLQLFIGWEGVGLCSYLLINFWYTRIQANKSALKAMIVNRVSDLCLLFGLCLLYIVFGSFDMSVIFNILPLIYSKYSTEILFIAFFFMIGAVGKSAQIGLHTWLPDAMEGPTPVSALIHSATMVTAGIFLIIRSSHIIEYVPLVKFLITCFGILTAFMSATIALVQNDIKKVIAYSTCSQLGYMFFSCGMSLYNVALYHLITHGFFKALLFLCAGNIIHSVANEQDMRKYGGFLNFIPLTYVLMLIGSLSIIGFPFMSGFYSKDSIFEFLQEVRYINPWFYYFFGSLTALFTAFYSFRLIFLVFLSSPRGSKGLYSIYSHKIMESNKQDLLLQNYVLYFLALAAIFAGYLLKDLLIGIGTDFLGNSILVNIHNYEPVVINDSKITIIK
jgi:NADH-ubiquinone oxidoreductase chain 5